MIHFRLNDYKRRVFTMKFFLFTLLLYTLSNVILGQDSTMKNLRIEIRQHNIITGKSGIYVVKGKMITRYIRHSERLKLPKLIPTFMSKQESDSIKFYTTNLIDNLGEDNSYADYAVLDGGEWTVIIEKDSKKYEYIFSNCSCVYIDKLIKYLNLKLDKRALIYPTDFMEPKKCCN
jgi:hypothetical protein